MVYTFGDCIFDTRLRQLRRAGRLFRLRPKVFQVLLHLLEHRDHVVTKDELAQHVWPVPYISDAIVEGCIKEVRRALGDSGRSQRYIQTQHGYGYRFVAACRCQETPPAVPPLPWVGRAQELAALHSLLARAENGAGQVVGIQGAPGIGKSRLLDEFRQRLASPSVRYLATRGYAERPVRPALAARELLEHYCAITIDESPAVKRTKLQRCLEAAGLAADSSHSLLPLLGSADEAAQRTPSDLAVRLTEGIAAFCELFLAGSRLCPLVMAIDDLDWLDTASVAYLSALVEYLAPAPILLLTASAADPQPAWLAAPHTTFLTLAPLSDDESTALVQTLLPAEPAQVVSQLVTPAAGQPRFLESAARLLANQGRVKSPALASESALLTARLEDLSTSALHLLQCLAVLGWTSTPALLEVLWEGPGTCAAAQVELHLQGLASPQPGAGDASHMAVAPVWRELAYASLVPARRQALHRMAAQALEVHMAASMEESVERLAYHYTRAGEVDKALALLRQAAERALQCGAEAEAAYVLQEALALTAQLPPGLAAERLSLMLRLRLAEVLAQQQQYSAAQRLLVAYQQAVEALQDPPLSGRWWLLLSGTHSHLGAWEQVAPLAQRAIDYAQQGADKATLAAAYHLLALERHWAGRPLQGLEASQRAVALLEQAAPGYDLGLAYVALGLNALVSGDFLLTLDVTRRLHALGESCRDTHLQTCAAWVLGWCEASRGHTAAGIAACQRAFTLAPDPLNAAFAIGWLGYSFLEHGQPEAALPRLTQAIDCLQQLHYERYASLFITFWGEAQRLQGQLTPARDAAQQGYALAQQTQYIFGMAHAQRLRGQIAQATGNLAEARHSLTESCAIFTAMPARFEAGRSHLVLADLAYQQGEQATASHHVHEAHRLFTVLHMPEYGQRTGQRLPALQR